jgi:crotonobetainyl-CoA:carnitine CoA-transferase CaiB-like acyl-CoA transferase
LLHDPRFADRDSFAQHQDEFDALLISWLLERTRAEAFAELQRHRVMCAPIFDFVEALADPQQTARGFFRTTADPVLGPLTVPGSTFGHEGGASPCTPSVLPGADNEAVYHGLLGIDEARLSRLRQARVV